MRTLATIGIFAVIALLWLLSPQLSGWKEINEGIKEIERIETKAQLSEPITFGANTYTNEISSAAVEKHYNKAAKALIDKSSETKTYRWSDEMGWPRLSTVLQLSAFYIEVCVSNNNDNDSVHIMISPGVFSKNDSELLTTHELPNGILREN